MSDSNTPITIGIVGLGRAGWSLHLQPILKLDGFKIIAVADPVAERTAEARELTGCEVFSNVDELLAGSDAQAVVVATPSFTHYSDVKKVLLAGRHCIAEKPLAMRVEEARELVAIAKEKNLKMFVNHAHLHRDEFYHLKEVVDSNILGPIFEVRACWAGYARRWDWQTLKKNGGGQLNNTAPHTLSIVLPLLGAPVKSVFADLRNIKDAGDAEDHVHLVMTAENGTTADVVVTSAVALSQGPKWMLCGKNGTLVSDGTTSTIRYYDPGKVEDLSVLDAAAPGRQYLRETLPWEEKTLEVKPSGVVSFHQNVLDVLLGKADQIVTPESTVEVVRVTEMAHEFAQF